MATQLAIAPNGKTSTLGTPLKYANPFSEFRHEMDGLFDRFFASKPAYDFRLPDLENGGKRRLTRRHPRRRGCSRHRGYRGYRHLPPRLWVWLSYYRWWPTGGQPRRIALTNMNKLM